MAISKTNDLFHLVKSLSKSEKRSFRIFAERFQTKDSLQYLLLFDVLVKIDSPNDAKIQAKLNGMAGLTYSNTKRHLYEQILTVLRLTEKKRMPNIRVRELIDYAHLLYGKGFYMQALRILAKAKKLAEKNHTDFSQMMIIELEKKILSRHITRSKKTIASDKITESSIISQNIHNRVTLSNLRLFLHNFYVEKGHVKNESERIYITEKVQQHTQLIQEDALGMMERVYLYQSYVSYYYILNDFEGCSTYAQKWVQLFNDTPELKVRDIDLLFRGYHYWLTSLFFLLNIAQHKAVLLDVEEFRNAEYKTFNKNTRVESFLRVHAARLNQHFLDGTYTEGLENVKTTLRRIQRHRDVLDEHKVMVLYFKIAWMFFGAGDYGDTVKYLQYIINMTTVSLRDDIQTYSRILHLMAHYNLRNFDLIPFLNNQYLRFFEKIEEKNQFQNLCFNMFRTLNKQPVAEHSTVFTEYRDYFKKLEEDEFEKRAFLYLEIIPWIDTKLSNRSLSEIKRQKRLQQT